MESATIDMTQHPEVQDGLEGVVAFASEIAEPDREGGALRYRGVDIEELVGNVPFERVWGLLVDGVYEPGLPPAEQHPLRVRTGDARVDLQASLAMLATEWGFEQMLDIDAEPGAHRSRAQQRHGAQPRGAVARAAPASRRCRRARSTSATRFPNAS